MATRSLSDVSSTVSNIPQNQNSVDQNTAVPNNGAVQGVFQPLDNSQNNPILQMQNGILTGQQNANNIVNQQNNAQFGSAQFGQQVVDNSEMQSSLNENFEGVVSGQNSV